MKSSCSDTEFHAANDPMQSLKMVTYHRARQRYFYHMSPRKQVHDIKTGRITTMEQQKARSRQRNGLGIELDADPLSSNACGHAQNRLWARQY